MRNITSLGQARDYGERLSKLLKKYRELANFRLTQSDLATKIGVSARSIRDWESGINLPTARNLKKIIEVYYTSGLFTSGKEREEAEELWVLRQGEDLTNTFPLFDVAWLENATSASSDPQDKADIQSPEPTSIAEPAKNVTPFPAKLISGNLPQLLSSFIGRDNELAEIQRLLQTTRLLTITGTGGAGKTRLSQEVAHRLLETASDRFPDGFWWVELTPLTDPHHLVQSILSTLLPDRRQEGDLYELLQKFLQPKKLLLVLDNCEHLIEAVAALVQKLLRDCTSLQILATSREKLNLTGEQTWLLAGLSVPNQQTRQGEDPAGSAVQLFVERARAVDLLFELNSENTGAVLSICRQLDGLPLAIELAAARVRVLGVEQIARRLQQNLKLLSDGSRANLPHHQTVQAMIDWSYNLLSAEEQLLLPRMAVFRGDFSLEAAEGVLGGDAGPGSESLDPDDVLILLLQLVNKSLVVAVASKNNTETRYRLLEMVRQYSQEKLEASGETVYLTYKHLAYYTNLAENGYPNFLTDQSAKWVARLAQEVSNLHSAITWALAFSQHQAQVEPKNFPASTGELALRLGTSLARFWQLKNYIDEGASWLKASLALDGLAERDDLKPVRALAYQYLGSILWTDNQIEQNIQYLNLSLVLFEELDDKFYTVMTLANLGFVYMNYANYVEAKVYLVRSLALIEGIENQFYLGYILLYLGMIALAQSNLDEALAYLKKSESVHLLNHDNYALVGTFLYLGELSRIKQNLPQALSLVNESLQISQEIDNKAITVLALNELSVVQRNMQNYREARLAIEECAVICNETGNSFYLGAAYNNLALIHIKEGNLAEARRIGRQSLEIRQKNGNFLGFLENLHTFALLAASLNQWEEFVWIYTAAEVLRQQMGISGNFMPEQTELDHINEQVARHLDPATLDRLKLKGQTDSLDEIVKQVLI